MICYKEYHTIQGYECLSACITNYFNYLGLLVSGSDIFFVGGGFVITYEKKKKSSIGAKLYESNFMFLKNMSIPFQHTNLEESKDVMKFLRKSIEDEHFIAIKVSSECLEHNRVFKQTESSPHYLNILGYDDSTNNVFISDGYVPTFNPTVFEGWVDTNGIIEAWRRMDYEYVKLDLADIKISADEMHRIAIMNMKFGIQQYLNKSKQRLSSKFFGKEAITKLFEDILLMFDMQIDLKTVALDINYQLKIYGFITSKRFILQKLIILKMNECYLEQYSKIIDKWNQICNLLVKAGISRNKKSFELTLEKVNESINEEEKVLYEILNDL